MFNLIKHLLIALLLDAGVALAFVGQGLAPAEATQLECLQPTGASGYDTNNLAAARTNPAPDSALILENGDENQ